MRISVKKHNDLNGMRKIKIGRKLPFLKAVRNKEVLAEFILCIKMQEGATPISQS